MAASVWLMRMLFSRTSRRTVLKRKMPTSRRSGKSSASDEAPRAGGLGERVAHEIDVLDQAVGVRVAVAARSLLGRRRRSVAVRRARW